MPLIRSKAQLIIEAVAADNPNLPFVPTLDNCYVYALQTTESKRSAALIHGRFGTGYCGRHWVWFKKYDVAIMTKNCDLEVVENGGRTTLAYLEEINRRFGFDLKPNEVQDLPIMDNGTVCRLKPQMECLMYTGTVDFKLVGPQPDLAELITQRELEPMFNHHGVGVDIPGAMLAQGHDYSEVTDVLVKIADTLDTAGATTLSTALKSIDTVPWGIVANTLYSLVGASVIYNGPVVGAPQSLKDAGLIMPGYDSVLALTPVTENTGFTDTPIVIHYNVYIEIRS